MSHLHNCTLGVISFCTSIAIARTPIALAQSTPPVASTVVGESGALASETPGASSSPEPESPTDARFRAMELRLQSLETRLATASATSSAPPTPLAPPAASEPFAFGDFTWLNGNSRQHRALLDTPYFTGSFLLDVNYTYSLNHPIDNTVVGSTALSRNNEFTLAFVGFGGDFHYGTARGRLMTQFGMRSTVVPRNDFSTGRGQFDLQTALRYVSEAYGGLHLNVMHGINIDFGIFMSYVGLFSFDNFENWAYQPSFTSDNTPWFFNGLRIQFFPTDTFKAELWIINGWQTYGKFNELPGVGTQLMWRPVEWLSLVTNDYAGTDTQDHPGRVRFHSDNSVLVRYYNHPGRFFHRAAISLTADLGFEQGGGVVAFGRTPGPGDSAGQAACQTAGNCSQQFISAMAYHRMWFWGDHLGWTFGGGFMHNPGRYLVLLPTGAALATFDTSPGSSFDGWDVSTTIQAMPDEQQTWYVELVHREASVPYFAGRGGVTSPDGFSTTPIPAGWTPDLVKSETRLVAGLLVRF